VRAARRGMFIHYEADPGALQRCQEALQGLLKPASTPRHSARDHRGGSSCPRRSRPVKSRKN
jgi:hypothetical protein